MVGKIALVLLLSRTQDKLLVHCERSRNYPMLVLQNATWINNPRQEARTDLSIDGQGVVVEVKPSIQVSPNDNVLDLAGSFISPGWIDLHTHLYYGVSNLGVRPNKIGLKAGVTVLNDAGTAGESTFLGLRENIIDRSEFPIYAFLNLSSMGLISANRISELDSLDKIDLDATVACVESNRDIIRGIKVRASGVIFRMFGVELLKLGRALAREVRLPLMVHVGEPLPLLTDILPTLDTGDILTHCYHGKRWGILSSQGLIPEARAAWDRGVYFDVGHGEASLSFDVAEKAIALGFPPFSISTDLHSRNIDGPVFDLSTTMSKMLGLGMSLPEVMGSVTTAPAKILGIEDFHDCPVGQKARFTVFKVVRSRVVVSDSVGERRTLEHIIIPTYAILGNRVVKTKTRFTSVEPRA